MKQPDSDAPRPTPEEITQIIADTYSAQPPDPFEPSPATLKVMEALNVHPTLEGRDTVTRLWIEGDTVPDWQPEFADKLEHFLSDNHPASEQRLQELRNGAALTEDEQEAYETQFWEWDSYVEIPLFYVVSLRAPESTGETRTIYFVQEWREMGQNASLHHTVGPFRTAKEVRDAINGEKDSPLTPNTFGGFSYEDLGDPAFTKSLESA